MADKKLQPIIIKRIKKGGHVAHGGAWKIAYADFVTAMMAFFLLMWLLGSTSKGDLNGIASYFTAPVKISLMGGDGTGNSESILPGGGRDLSKSAGQVDGGDAERAAKLIGAQMARAELARKDAVRIDALQKKISEMVANNPALAEFGNQIKLEQTEDGLQIQIVDEQNRPMFDVGSAIVKPYMRDILREIGGALVGVENRIALSGHTDAMPYGSGDRGYSNWELSADRANASRRELVTGGLPDAKMARVEGLASSRLFDPDNPNAPVNRRISILVLTREAEERLLQRPLTDAELATEMPAPGPDPVSAEAKATPFLVPPGSPETLEALQKAREMTKSPTQPRQ
ncbi:flagellar motor protein MotB [Hydrogenophaga crassostreae]|uniref:flagellar motor protein MotB n=1 Tax=Hydrogenophaga crassostreae TaxID=1763535 RepID=UPI0009EF37A6|nr:flagellar motor protein MotB [Hydrogenophaga crassostreae]